MNINVNKEIVKCGSRSKATPSRDYIYHIQYILCISHTIQTVHILNLVRVHVLAQILNCGNFGRGYFQLNKQNFSLNYQEPSKSSCALPGIPMSIFNIVNLEKTFSLANLDFNWCTFILTYNFREDIGSLSCSFCYLHNGGNKMLISWYQRIKLNNVCMSGGVAQSQRACLACVKAWD